MKFIQNLRNPLEAILFHTGAGAMLLFDASGGNILCRGSHDTNVTVYVALLSCYLINISNLNELKAVLSLIVCSSLTGIYV